MRSLDTSSALCIIGTNINIDDNEDNRFNFALYHDKKTTNRSPESNKIKLEIPEFNQIPPQNQ